MAIIPQTSFFDYSEIDLLGDLERLNLARQGIDDEQLMRRLEKKRGKGRDDFPVRVMWNLVIAMKVFEHPTVSSFRRELDRNPHLRRVCGLTNHMLLRGRDASIDPATRKMLAPSAGVFSRFMKLLVDEDKEREAIFDAQVEELRQTLSGFGTATAGDGKYIESFARRKPPADQARADGRTDSDAEWSGKQQTYTDSSGNQKSKTIWHFGYRAHIICDVTYELPIAFSVTPANNDEKTELRNLLARLRRIHPELVESMETIALDRGYDDAGLIRLLKGLDVAPVVDIRNMWRNNKKGYRQYKNTHIWYDYAGNVFWQEDDGNDPVKMKYAGYDKQKKCLCYMHEGKRYRLFISFDERVFLPIARDSEKFRQLYKGRTAVERLNARLDRDYLFEDHTIRGLEKMKLMVSLSVIIMNGMALGKLRKGLSGVRSLKSVA